MSAVFLLIDLSNLKEIGFYSDCTVVENFYHQHTYC